MDYNKKGTLYYVSIKIFVIYEHTPFAKYYVYHYLITACVALAELKDLFFDALL